MPTWWPFGAQEIKQDVDAAATFPVGYGQDWFQAPGTDTQNLQTQAMRSAVVYACLRELCTSITEPRFTVLLDTDSEPIEAPESNPIRRLLARPNDSQDIYDLLEDIIVSYYLTGNCFLHKERSASGTLQSVRLLRTDRIEIKSSPDEGIVAYKYTLNGVDYYLAPGDVSHLKFPNPMNDLYGYSPLQAAASALNLDLAQTAYAQSFMRNQATPAGLLTVKKRLNNEDEANRIRTRWRSTFGGANRFSVAVLDEDATFQQLGSKLGDIALEELRNTVESRLCGVMGVPPILVSTVLGLDRATYSNYSEARKTYMNETVQSLAGKLSRWLTRCFGYEFRDAGYVVADFSRVSALAEDLTVISDRVINQYNSGLISLNEARSYLSLNPLNGGDIRRVPINIIESSTDQVEPSTLALETGQTLSLEPGELKALPDQLIPDTAIKPEPADFPARYDGLMSELLDARIAEVENLDPKLQRYFRGLINRIDGILGNYLQRDTQETKQVPFSAEELLPVQARNDLANILRDSYANILRRSFFIMNNSGQLDVLDFSEQLPFVQSLMASANERAAMIHDTTWRDVARIIERSAQEGYTVAEIANGVPGEMRGIRTVFRENYAGPRSLMIARTEAKRAQNITTLGYYQATGMEFFQAIDLDGGPDDNHRDPADGRTCAERNGQIYHISQNPMDIDDHPNGTLSWSPMPPSYQPEFIEAHQAVIDMKETNNG
tara:strand:- start:1238 stop:3403 length:2166 start_codon:yes stop_codon:yes gene_type:complete